MRFVADVSDVVVIEDRAEVGSAQAFEAFEDYASAVAGLLEKLRGLVSITSLIFHLVLYI